MGRTLSRKWRLDELIGTGGMADVYAATHGNNGMRVAIKILRSELAESSSAVKRFRREGYAANRVGHPGAVRVLDDDTDDTGAPFLVMELLEGETLHARWRRAGQRLPVADVLAALDDALDVLVAAHGQGIVHRDIKPGNLLRASDGRVKVLDFGIARLHDPEREAHDTRSNVSMGTPAFMAPEQARGRWEEVDARTDVWAVGATMFTLLTGVHVHDARTANEMMIAAATQPAPRLTSLLPTVPPRVAALVDRALAFVPAERWQTAREMQAALRQAKSSLSDEVSPRAPLRLEIDDTHPAHTGDVSGQPSEQRGVTTLAESTTQATGHDVEPAPPTQRTRRPTIFVLLGGITLLLVLGTWLARQMWSHRGSAAPVLVDTAAEPPESAAPTSFEPGTVAPRGPGAEEIGTPTSPEPGTAAPRVPGAEATGTLATTPPPPASAPIALGTTARAQTAKPPSTKASGSGGTASALPVQPPAPPETAPTASPRVREGIY